MTDVIGSKTGSMFWILGVFFLIWNFLGCAAYLMDVSMSDEAYLEAYGAAMAAVRDKYPAWSIAAYAIAVWSGLAAAVLLLLRKKLSATLFIVSLIAAVISFYWGMTNAEARAAAGPYGWIMPVLVFGIGAVEIWWSRKKAADGSLG